MNFKLILSILAVAAINLIGTGAVHAAPVTGFSAGKIIDDNVFTNTTTMSVDQIQTFLNSKVSVCDTWGTQPSEFGGGTRRQWAEARGYYAPYTCLKDYTENGKSSAQIIYDVSSKYSINPQVMIVLLQKEQGLVTDTWPTSIQYRSATGYGCPDTAACDSQYYGLTNQIDWAAKMFRSILNNSPGWYTPYVLGNNYIRYNPQESCGGSNVNIQNRSTQALYNYTPYQPNQGALDAGWGTAPCGAYGNRNFYLYFTEWFGSTYGAPGACDATVPNVVCVWELIKPNGEFFYTSNVVERDASLRNGLSYNKVAFYARPHNGGAYTSSQPVYRLQQSGNHFWTSNAQLRQQYLTSGWSDEGVAWYADPSSANTGTSVYKLRNSSNKHIYVGYRDYARYTSNGYTDTNETLIAPTKVVQTAPTTSPLQNIYRLITCQNSYLFTTSILEVESVLGAKCAQFEGVAHYASGNNAAGTIPVTRFHNNGRYIWTTSQAEASSLSSRGWQSEGVAYYINSESGAPVIRLSQNGRYIWTMSQAEATSLSRAGWMYEGIAFYAPGTASNGTAVSRFYNNGRYIWTTSQAEATNLSIGGWKYEGIAYYAGKNSSEGAAVNRFYNNGRYIWTTSQAEASGLTAGGWTNEGVAYYASTESANSGAAVNRFYNNGRYIWTTSQAEASGLTAGGWTNEGVAYYAKP